MMRKKRYVQLCRWMIQGLLLGSQGYRRISMKEYDWFWNQRIYINYENAHGADPSGGKLFFGWDRTAVQTLLDKILAGELDHHFDEV